MQKIIASSFKDFLMVIFFLLWNTYFFLGGFCFGVNLSFNPYLVSLRSLLDVMA